jgi:lambda repressor-like predicted transcriptional regulator
MLEFRNPGSTRNLSQQKVLSRISAQNTLEEKCPCIEAFVYGFMDFCFRLY